MLLYIILFREDILSSVVVCPCEYGSLLRAHFYVYVLVLQTPPPHHSFELNLYVHW